MILSPVMTLNGYYRESMQDENKKEIETSKRHIDTNQAKSSQKPTNKHFINFWELEMCP